MVGLIKEFAYFFFLDNKILSSEYTFTIVYKPRDTAITANPYFPTSTIFECVPMKWGKFQIEIKWFYNNKELVENNEIKMTFFNRRLIIPNILSLAGKGNHQAVIKCEVETPDDLIHDYHDARLDIFGRKIEKIFEIYFFRTPKN